MNRFPYTPPYLVVSDISSKVTEQWISLRAEDRNQSLLFNIQLQTENKGPFLFAGFTLKIWSRSVLTLMLWWKHELQLWLFPAIAQREEDNRFEERETGPGRNSEITTYLFEVEAWN